MRILFFGTVTINILFLTSRTVAQGQVGLVHIPLVVVLMAWVEREIAQA
jgi:hypothetical protein